MKMDITERARRYLAGIPPATAGSGGDAATFKTAVALVKGFNLPPEEALPLLMGWNAACVPPWSESALRAKLASAARSAASSGYLLKDRTRSAAAGAKQPARSGSHQDRSPREPAPASADEEKATKRSRWPVFQRTTAAERAAIAALRGVSGHAVELIACHRYLWRCHWRGEECLAIRKGTFAQVRRMDGQPFTRQDGSTIKALNLPGSEGAFLNPGGMGEPDVPVILTEGAISILEAAEAIQRADGRMHPLHSVAVLAAISAQSRFTSGHLAKLRGRRVRIIPDADSAGQEAAANWTATLRSAGCTVDCVRQPGGCKDLGDALRAISATNSLWRELLTF